MLEEAEQLEPRVSALEEDMDDVESSEEEEEEDEKVRHLGFLRFLFLFPNFSFYFFKKNYPIKSMNVRVKYSLIHFLLLSFTSIIILVFLFFP